MSKRSASKILPLAAFLLLLAIIWSFASTPTPDEDRVFFFFWGKGCPHCEEAKPFLKKLQERHPELEVRDYDIIAGSENLQLWVDTAERFGGSATGVPAFYFGEENFTGFSPEIGRRIEEAVAAWLGTAGAEEAGPMTLPLLGEVDPSDLSLPIFTLIIAGLDSFNPCAFFVLLFLLGLLIHAHSRRRMLLIGGTFVFCSGLIYFLFMAAWLKLFLLVGHIRSITLAAGLVALVIGLINVKDFFFFKKGVSLSIPEGAKPKLFARMRGLLKADSLAAMLTGTLVLAVAANSYEILCTAGFPMVFTRVLTLQELSAGRYYLYLLFYNLIYVVPLTVIVLLFTLTLGSRKLTERQGRTLKLVSGTMMVLLGGVLLAEPALLNNALLSSLLLLIALAISGATALLWKRREGPEG